VSTRCLFSIIIPVLHESEIINTQLESLKNLEAEDPFEIIVVDGSPTRDTLRVITETTVILCSCPQGRGRQMNVGAAEATGDILVFLHADTSLPRNALQLIQEQLQNHRLVGGAFSLLIDSRGLLIKMTAAFSTFRSCVTRAPYGDQVIFLRKTFFDEIGGYQDIPLMEDVELMRRVKKKGGDIVILPTAVVTSDRRWRQEGLWYTTLRNSVIIFLYWCGVSAEKLAKIYPWNSP
jgi:rSAM/selenodomain-associated transferase 2